MTKTAADVEREVEASRGELDRTVEALKEKMTPGQLFDEASRAMGGAGQQVLAKFVEQAKENPMPLAVMGLGLAWLMAGPSKPSRGYDGRYEPRSFAPDEPSRPGLGDKAHAVADKAAHLLGETQDKLSNAAASAGETGRAAARNLSSMASTAKDKAATYRDQAQEGFSALLEREPLLIAGMALAVGAVVGAALPATAAEDKLAGETRDKLLEKGKTALHDGMQKAGGLAQAAYGGVKSELENGDGDLSQRMESAGHAGAQAIRDELRHATPQ